MKYYVLSLGGDPVRLLFDEVKAKEVAEESNIAFLDVFDADGIHIDSMKYHKERGSEEGTWTNTF
jgi:hypothetical protein